MNKILAVVVGSVLLLSAGPAFASVNITLNGGSVTVPQKGSFVDPGYSAFSTTDGDVTGSVSVVVPSTNTTGIFSVGYSVTDSALDSASASRTLTVTGGGGGAMPYCSGPFAPGWKTGEVGGGCGGTSQVIAAGASIVAHGAVYTCPEWFGSMGCVVQ